MSLCQLQEPDTEQFEEDAGESESLPAEEVEMGSEAPIDILSGDEDDDDDDDPCVSEYGSEVEPCQFPLTDLDGSTLDPIPSSQPKPEPVDDTVPVPASNEAVVGSDDDVGDCSDVGSMASASHVVEPKGDGESHGISNGSLVENMPGDADAEACSYDNFTPEDKKLPYIPPETDKDRAVKKFWQEEMEEMKELELRDRIAKTQKMLADLRAAQNAQTLAWYKNVTSFRRCLNNMFFEPSFIVQYFFIEEVNFSLALCVSFHGSHLPGLPAASLCRRRLTRKARSWFVTVSHLVWTPWTLCQPIPMR